MDGTEVPAPVLVAAALAGAVPPGLGTPGLPVDCTDCWAAPIGCGAAGCAAGAPAEVSAGAVGASVAPGTENGTPEVGPDTGPWPAAAAPGSPRRK